MAFGGFKVHAGAFTSGQLLRGKLHMSRGVWRREKIPLSEIALLEVATEESVNRLGSAVGWGLAGEAAFGPIGLLAGLLRGGRGKAVLFVCGFKDGRKFLATASQAQFTQMRTALAVSQFNDSQDSHSLQLAAPSTRTEYSRRSQKLPAAITASDSDSLKYLAWFGTAIFAIGGIGVLRDSFLTGICLIGTAAMIFPPLNDLLSRYWNVSLPDWVRWSIGVVLFAIAGTGHV